MRSYLPFLTLVLSATFFVPATPVHAQRGQLIEDLFRTIADAQLEREQRKRAEAELEARRPKTAPPTSIQPVPVPGSIFPNNPSRTNRPGGLQPINPDRSRPGTRGTPPMGAINVRSREAAEFANNIVAFSAAMDPLVRDMRSGAAKNPAIRELLPEAFQVAADTRALIQRCDGLAALTPIAEPYSELDARWRNLSFRLRSMNGLSNQCTTSIRTCDKLVSTISRQLHLQPQFDRHELHDLMVIASTHMLTLMDDLQMARISPQDVQRLTHDCRLLRQRLLREADRVDETSYEDVVTRFTDFVRGWGAFSQQVYALNDPYLQRRLDRIREAGDQTYALLWMPPPYNAGSLTVSANRLHNATADLLDQMTIRAMVSLSSREQVRVLETSRRMYRLCGELTESSKRNASRADLARQFSQIDSDWNTLRSGCAKISSMKRATLAAIDQECDRIRVALGVTPGSGQSIRFDELIQAAAALEGSAEYFEADIQRYKRYFQPAAYRDSIVASSHEFFHHAKQLHSKLSQRAEVSVLQTEAEHMLDGWEQLSRDLSDVERHGLSSTRARNLQQARADLVPVVAQIAAALVQR
ncbi:MAG: hypothetical protein AB8B91_14820 [Rubripirellula sp.]